MLISKMQTYLSDKMPPKKLKFKNKKKWDLTNLENRFLILTFWGGILSLRQVCFFEISFKILDFLIPYMTRKKIVTSQKSQF